MGQRRGHKTRLVPAPGRVCVQRDQCLPAPQPTGRSGAGRRWHFHPQTLSITQGLFKVSLKTVLVLRRTRLFIDFFVLTTKLQVSAQEHLVQCRPNRLHISCAHLSTAGVSWVTLLPFLTPTFLGPSCSLARVPFHGLSHLPLSWDLWKCGAP